MRREKLKMHALVEEIQALITIGVDPNVAATTVNDERSRRATLLVTQPGNYPVPVNSFHHRIFYMSLFYLRLMNLI